MKLIERTPPSIRTYIDNKIGRLTVIKSYYCPDNKRYYVKCQCDCGDVRTMRFDRIKSGAVVSCGCHRDEQSSKRMSDLNITHGMSGTRVYNRWIGIKLRCQKPDHEKYKFYGARGIRVCKGWESSFEEFYQDIGDIEAGETIDRKDNNKHYSCGRCPECINNGWEFNIRLVSMAKQNRNRRSNIEVTMNGKTMTLKDWAGELGINPKTVYTRVSRGWDATAALTVPIREVNQSWRNDD